MYTFLGHSKIHILVFWAMTPYSMGVDTNVLMDHTASTNEDHYDYANNINSLNRGSVVRPSYW